MNFVLFCDSKLVQNYYHIFNQYEIYKRVAYLHSFADTK